MFNYYDRKIVKFKIRYMTRKDPFPTRPPSQYQKEEFYWRGGNPLNEQEYLVDEFRVALEQYNRSLENYNQVKQQLDKETKILNDREGYTDALAQFLDGNPDDLKKENELKQKLQGLEADIQSLNEELQELQLAQNTAFAGSLQSEIAYLMIEIKRTGKTAENASQKNDDVIKQLAVMSVSPQYQEIRIKENNLKYLQQKNKELKAVLDDLNSRMVHEKSEPPIRSNDEISQQRSLMVDQMDDKINIKNLRLKEKLHPMKHQNYVDHLFSIVKELNDHMKELNMEEEDMVDIDDLQSKIYPEMTEEEEEKERQEYEEKFLLIKSRRENRRRSINAEFQRDKQLKERAAQDNKKRQDEERRQDAERTRLKSEQQRRDLLQKYQNKNEESSSPKQQKKEEKPVVVRPKTSKSISRNKNAQKKSQVNLKPEKDDTPRRQQEKQLESPKAKEEQPKSLNLSSVIKDKLDDDHKEDEKSFEDSFEENKKKDEDSFEKEENFFEKEDSFEKEEKKEEDSFEKEDNKDDSFEKEENKEDSFEKEENKEDSFEKDEKSDKEDSFEKEEEKKKEEDSFEKDEDDNKKSDDEFGSDDENKKEEKKKDDFDDSFEKSEQKDSFEKDDDFEDEKKDDDNKKDDDFDDDFA